MFGQREKMVALGLYLFVGLTVAAIRLTQRLESPGQQDNVRLLLRSVFELLAWPVALVAGLWK